MPMTWPVPVAFFRSDICTSVYSIILGSLLLLVVQCNNLFNEVAIGEHAQNWQYVISNGLAWNIFQVYSFYHLFNILADTVVNYFIRGCYINIPPQSWLPKAFSNYIFCWHVSCLYGAVVVLALTCTTLVVYSPMYSTTAAVISGSQSNNAILFFIIEISAQWQYRILSLNCDNGGWVGLGIQRNESIFRDILLYISPRVTTKLNVSPDLMKTLVFVEFLPCCQALRSSGYSLYLFIFCWKLWGLVNTEKDSYLDGVHF